VAAEPEQRAGGREADQRGLVDLGRERHRTQDADHGEVPPAQVYLGVGVYLGDAERPGRDRAEDRGRIPGRGRVQERACGQAAAEGAEQPGLGGQHRDASAVHGGHGRGTPHGGAGHVPGRGHRLDRRDVRDHRLGGQRQRRGRAVERLPGADRQQVPLGAQLGQQAGLGRGRDAQHRDRGSDADRDAQAGQRGPQLARAEPAPAAEHQVGRQPGSHRRAPGAC
jgi:hypothetical protein